MIFPKIFCKSGPWLKRAILSALMSFVITRYTNLRLQAYLYLSDTLHDITYPFI